MKACYPISNVGNGSARIYELLVWWGTVIYGEPIITMQKFVHLENNPRNQWENYLQALYYDDNW